MSPGAPQHPDLLLDQAIQEGAAEPRQWPRRRGGACSGERSCNGQTVERRRRAGERRGVRSAGSRRRSGWGEDEVGSSRAGQAAVSPERKAAVLAAEERYFRNEMLRMGLAERGVYVVGPLTCGPIPLETLETGREPLEGAGRIFTDPVLASTDVI